MNRVGLASLCVSVGMAIIYEFVIVRAIAPIKAA
jgi:hypothetical protein